MENNWKYKSLANLQKMGDFASKPGPTTHLVRRCDELLSVPLNEYTIDDLRIMIGQQIGLPYLILLALEILENDLFAEGDFFPGDLVKNVLSIDVDFWKKNTCMQEQLKILISNRKTELTSEGISFDKFESSFV
jgi:hypothetical protein